MFDNINWEIIINNILTYVKKDWKYLIVKFVISKTSYSIKFYYSKNGKEYIDLYNIIDDDTVFQLMDSVMNELENLIEKFDDHKEIMFLTIKAEKSGNVKIIYKDIKNGNKLPYDESNKYLQLSDNDKIIDIVDKNNNKIMKWRFVNGVCVSFLSCFIKY